jgi:hypothetical protein
MITYAQSMPERSSTSAIGQSVVWSQFNDLSVFFEDEFQETFYRIIAQRVFPQIKISKVFCIKGKESVKEKARNSINDKNRVFIVDLDFDHLLQKTEALPNLFYLSRYSIENHLIECSGIREIVREHTPSVKKSSLRTNATVSALLKKHRSLLRKLCVAFLAIQKHGLGLAYFKISAAKHISYPNRSRAIITKEVDDYFSSVDEKLKAINPTLCFNSEFKKYIRFFKSYELLLRNCPGKYLIEVSKVHLETTFGIPQSTPESFCYRLAKNCDLSSLQPLKNSIELYITPVGSIRGDGASCG